jgi:phosphoribosyl-ATP pyrophosphohydrolase
MGKSVSKKKLTLRPIRALVPVAKAKPKGKLKPDAKIRRATLPPTPQPIADTVLDRLYDTVVSRRDVDPSVSHSARLLARGIAKVAQKFGEEAVECLIAAVAGDRQALIAESADVLYHLLVLWVASDVRPDQVWAELARREGISGIAEKASRPLARRLNTSKIP